MIFVFASGREARLVRVGGLMSFVVFAVAVGLALASSFAVTPFLVVILRRYGFVDYPDGRRKLHVGGTVVGGGVGVWVGTSVGLIAATLISAESPEAAIDLLGQRLPVLLVACFLCVGGLIDDRVSLRGRQKLILQVIAAVCATYICGLAVTKVSVFGQTVDVGVVGFLFSVCWLLAAINAVNLLDGSDGTASIVGICIGAGLAAMCICNSRAADAVLPAVLAASLLGFLPYNFPPARVYLGDAGSQLIGLLLGISAIQSSLKGPTTVAMAGIIAVWTIPLLDTSAAILRRKLTGKSVYASDRGHLHHRLQARGFGSRRLLATITVLSVLTVAGGVASVAFRREWVAWSTVLVVVTALLLARVFGHAEAKLVAQRGRSFASSLIQRKRSKSGTHSLSRVYGTAEWQPVWQALVEYSQKFDAKSIRLEIHLPQLDEDFVAHWKHAEIDSDLAVWHAEMPLVIDGKRSGVVQVSGCAGARSACLSISQFADGLSFLEADIAAVMMSHDKSRFEAVSAEAVLLTV